MVEIPDFTDLVVVKVKENEVWQIGKVAYFTYSVVFIVEQSEMLFSLKNWADSEPFVVEI